MKSSSYAAIAAITALASLFASGAEAQKAPFYQGKQLTLFVNYAAGGSTDTEARVVARHLSAHIPGHPAIIVRNMPGAGGLVGANYLGEVAAPDGLTLGYLTGFGSRAMMGDPHLRVNILKFGFVAADPGTTVSYIRTDVPPGLKVPADIMKTKSFWLAGYTPDDAKDLHERLTLDLLGLHYNYVTGYSSSPAVRLALERNEVQMFSESLPDYRTKIEPDLVKTGKVIPLWYDPLDNGETFYTPLGVKGIPALRYDLFLKQIKGALPNSEMWTAWRTLNATSTSLLRMLLMPPGTPPAEVAILQKALVGLADDAAYKADAMKTLRFVPRFSVGDKTVRLFHKAMNPGPAVRQFFRRYIAEGERLATRHR